MSNDKILELILAISRKIAWFFVRKMTKNGMNENPENWHCVITSCLKTENLTKIFKKVNQKKENCQIAVISETWQNKTTGL